MFFTSILNNHAFTFMFPLDKCTGAHELEALT
jgi:hypothetical protein